jgi:hypothetical protein
MAETRRKFAQDFRPWGSTKVCWAIARTLTADAVARATEPWRHKIRRAR